MSAPPKDVLDTELIGFVDFHSLPALNQRRAAHFLERHFQDFKGLQTDPTIIFYFSLFESDHFLYWKKQSPIGPLVVSIIRVPSTPPLFRALVRSPYVRDLF